MKESNFISYDKTKLVSYLFMPDEKTKAKGVVQFAHGMQEYSKNYFSFAQYLAKKGFICFLFDERGHGKTAGESKLGKVEGDGDIFLQTVNDHLFVSEMLIKEYKLPVFFLGHSYGSFIGQEYILRKGKAEKIVLIGSSYMKTPLVAFGNFVAGITRAFKGNDAHAKLVEKLSFGAYKKKFSDGSWITSDEILTKMFYDDKFNATPFSAGFFKSMFSHQLKLYRKKELENVDKKLPVLILSGDRDVVGSMGKGSKKLYEFYKKKGLNVAFKLYPNLRHALLLEKGKEKIYEEILNFFIKKL